MPHIVLEGPVDLESFCRGFQPIYERTNGMILRVQDIFISQKKTMLLLEAIVVEDGPPIGFLIQVGLKGNRTTVRLYPGTDPQKTTGVKKLIALVAKKIKDQNSQIHYGVTNLVEFII